MSTPASRIEHEYDTLRYPNVPMFKTHPDNLATLGRLCGLQPASVTSCRVLELGCGSADNLLPMAATLPQSEIVGVDVSAAHLAYGRRRADALALTNLELVHCDIVDLDDSLGLFDYIICHGVFSWVAPPVRDAILAVCGNLLTPSGIAYVSYNAQPGWHLLALLRGMLLRNVGEPSESDSPLDRVRRARETLALLEHAADMPGNPVAGAIAPELARLRNRTDGYLFHEYLTEHNEGFWFADFVAQAQEHGLRYLANAEPETMTPSNYGPAVAGAVEAIADPIAAQQQLDIALGRSFNCTLLCRAGQPVRHDVSARTLDSMYVRAWIEPDPSVGDVHDPTPVVVTATSGTSAQLAGPDLRVALGLLYRAKPAALLFEEIVQAVLAQVPEASSEPEERRFGLAANLLRLYFGTVVGLSTYRRDMTSEVGPNPTATPLARLQASEQDWVTNQWHQRVPLSEHQRRLLTTLDGSTRDVEGRDGEAETLATFARCGLLVA